MQPYEDIEAEVRKLAHSYPPSDFGSHRAIQAITEFVVKKLEQERASIFALREMTVEAERLGLYK